jgi:putative ABC transport system ATP-binding protein
LNVPACPEEVLALDKVGLTYAGPPPVRALQGVDLRVRRGEYLAVVGPSGSGKSTFLNLIGLLDAPTEGSYSFEGVDVGALSDRRRTALRGSAIGFVFQSFHLLPHRTAVENVALALLYNGSPRTGRTDRAMKALDDVGLSQRATALSAHLSGGERQRVAIARALVNSPRLLLCDEPTGNLDSKNAAEVLSLIQGLHAQGQTVVLITHDPSVADRAQRRVQIQDGRLLDHHER